MQTSKKRTINQNYKKESSAVTTSPIIFDGRSFARAKEEALAKEVKKLRAKGIIPHLNVIMTSHNPASELYVKLKCQAAERVGIEVEVFYTTTGKRDYKYILNLLAVFNRDPLVHGIMFQLPLGLRFRAFQKKLLDAINPVKDVDGLRSDTTYTPATVRAIISIIDEARKKVLMINPPLVFVIGSRGIVGSATVKALSKLGYPIKEYDVKMRSIWTTIWGIPPFMSQKADIIVSAVGMAGVLKEKHIRQGAAVIDVGSPKPDARFEEVSKKSSFITPVPGGVGPVTIVSLLENVVTAAYNSQANTHLEG